MKFFMDLLRAKFLRVALAISLVFLVVPQVAIAAPRNVNVSGNIKYQDAGGANRPVVNARIEIRSWPQNVELASAKTDANGDYFVSFVADSAITRVFVRMLTLSQTGATTHVRVVKPNNSLNFADTNDVALPIGNGGITKSWVVGVDGQGLEERKAFHVFDRIGRLAFDRLIALVGWSNNGNLHVGFPEPETSYNPVTDRIKIEAVAGFDDASVLHEFSHYVMDQHYLVMPITLCGFPWVSHSVGIPSDPPCAFSEGWAHFLQGVIRAVPAYDSPTLSFSLEDATNFGAGPKYEEAIARALWDIYDNSPGPESWDQIALGLQANSGIWRVFDYAEPAGSQAFYGQWKQLNQPNLHQVERIFCHHRHKLRGCAYLPLVRR